MQYTDKFNNESPGMSLTSLRVKAEAVQYIDKLRLKVEAVY
jgi:hypothetical protein